MFDMIDSDKSGSVDIVEIKRFMKQSGIRIPDNQIASLVHMADTDGNEELDKDEFRILLTGIHEEGQLDLTRCLLAEFTGTFMFQFFGGMPHAGLLGNTTMLVVLIYTFAPVSGAIFNPALTAALWCTRQLTHRKAALYALLQIVACIQACVLLVLIGVDEIASETNMVVQPCVKPIAGLPIGKLFVLEFMCTFMLTVVFFACAVDTKAGWSNLVPLTVGMAGYGLALACGPISGVSLNPARFLGPCVVYGCFPPFWTSLVYVAASLAGAGLAGVAYMALLHDRPTPELYNGMANFQFSVQDTHGMRKKLRDHSNEHPEAAARKVASVNPRRQSLVW